MDKSIENKSKIKNILGNENNFIPLDVTFNVLARLEIENETDLLPVCEFVGLDQKDDLKYLKSCGHYKHLKFDLLRNNNNLSLLFSGGHGKRVKHYNILVKKLILRSPERFSKFTPKVDF
jgi:hypothetical protein